MGCSETALGKMPISEVSPAGSNPREGASFLAAQAELDKLTSIHASSPVDWAKVGDCCASVLRSEGKDLNASVWLLCAWTVTSGVEGLAAGVKVLREMLETYWDELTPPPARLRARRNQIDWMLEWLDDRLAQAPQPVAADLLAGLLEDWDALDAFWSSKDSDGPSFFRLRRRLTDLPVKETAPPPEVQAPAPVAVTPAVAVAPVPAPASVPTASPAVSPPATPAPVSVGIPDNDEAIEKTVNSVFSTLTPLIGFCLDHRPTLPLLFRLNRQQAWMTLEQAPPAQGSLTRLPPPADSLKEGFDRLQNAGEPLDILRFCEGNLASNPFWLDLNRASHAALSRLGGQAIAAASTVAAETLHLLQRLPTLVELSFSDGQPFADGVTRNWLEALAPQADATGAADATQVLIDEAGRAAAQGQLKEALAQLQSSAEKAQSARNRFRLRGAQIELLHRFDPRAQLGFALDVLLREAREKGLDRWEPELVLPLLELAVVHDDGGSRAVWAEQLAAMDLPTYLRLASSPAGG